MTIYGTLVFTVISCYSITLVSSAIIKSDNNNNNYNISSNKEDLFVSNLKKQKLIYSDPTISGQKQNVTSNRSYSNLQLKEEGRKKKQKDIMTRILPMMIIPFMLQTAIIPMMLTTLKFMLLKSAFIGKMAIILGLLNMFRNTNNEGGVFTHNILLGQNDRTQDHLMKEHYGYQGGEEYGAYVNRRKRNSS